MATITGTVGNDRLSGTAEADIIEGLEGDDILIGLDGDDELHGGEGDDRLDGGPGVDLLAGGAGNDAYVVRDAQQSIYELSDDGRDTVTAFVTYALQGVNNVERLVAGGSEAIDLTGSAFQANMIFGNAAANVLTGGQTDDNLYGRGGDDTLVGGIGHDLLDGGTGADAMTGGAGNDVYQVDDAGDTVTELAGEGNDRLVASTSFTLSPGAAVERLYTLGNGAIDLTGSDTANQITANNAANVLSGQGGDDRLTARGGNDTLLGGDGDDTLVGGTGADSMTGRSGDDTYYIDNAGDTVTEQAGDGTDRAYVDVSWTLGTGQAVETLIARGAGAITVTGNELANTIYGNRGASTLLGGDGDDVIHARAGNSVDGGNGADTIFITGGTTGEIRVTGDAGDSVESTDEGWVYAGQAMLDGVLVDRFVLGNTALLVDTGVDTSGIQTDPMFGIRTAATVDRQVIDLTGLAPARGFIIQGDTAGDTLGYYVSYAGDVNGDGFGDMIIGAHAGDDGGTDAGEAYVIFGAGSAFGTEVGGRRVIDLTSLAATQGFIIQGDTGSDSAGCSVASAGDVNGDGIDDLIIGAIGGDDGGTNAGEAYVVFGSDSGFGTDVGGRQVIDLTTLSSAQGFIIRGDSAGDEAGVSVSGAGDVNGDGFADMIVGARRADDGDNAAGSAYIIFGSGSGFGTDVGGRRVIDLTTLSSTQGFVIQGDTANDQTGHSVSSAGDVNGDGLDDLIVGAHLGDDGGSDSGEAYIVFGSTGGFGTTVGGRQVIDLTSLGATQGFIIQGDGSTDHAGFSVSGAGDFNGDGFGDLVVGAPNAGTADSGQAYVVFGSGSGFGTDVGGRRVIDVTTLSAAQGFVIQGDANSDVFGGSVASAGDVNGDGFDDLILGARYGDDGGINAGEAYVLFGSAGPFGSNLGGRQVIDLTFLEDDQGFIIQGDDAYDWTAGGVSSAGDINGDGFDDLIVGAEHGDDGGADAGEGYVLYGGPAGFSLQALVGGMDDTLVTGTAASERLIGSRGNDTLVGNGGADVFIGGQGDDLINIGSGNFFRIDGGNGHDEIVTTGNLDLTQLADGMIRHVESLNVTGSGAQTLTLDALDVLALGATNRNILGTSHDNVLFLRGDAQDSLDLSGFGAPASSTFFAGQTWNFYALNGKVVLAVDGDFQLV